MERALAVADAAADRAECRLIARRICELTEQEDFDEARRLREPFIICGKPAGRDFRAGRRGRGGGGR
jgi:hypothetical protein